MTYLKKYFNKTPLLLALVLLTACGATNEQPVTESVATVPTIEQQAEATKAVAETEATAEVVQPVSDDDVAESVAGDPEETVRPEDWSEETHSNDVDPNYAVVFPQEQVNTMTIVIDSAEWQHMLDNMTELYGEPSGEGRGGGGGGNRPAGSGEGGERPAREGGGNRPQGGEGRGGVNLGIEENPDYVTATVEFEGNEWTNVGIRFKGNSTLRNAWNSGSPELPFKLDFDEFEDDYPAIDNQRFYGFKQLSLSSPSTDASYVRAATAYDVMQDAGLIAPETAWYDLYVDYGDGLVSFGLYTFIEVIDDTVIKTALGDDDGNIYEGDGTGSSLAAGTFDQIPASFQKENNSKADYSDMEALYNALHAETRLTDADQWRSDLEAVFDVDTFLHWLAINSVMVNWDTYGQAAHNFYLYHDLDTDLLTWIGWDYNEALQVRRGSTAIDLADITDSWPLIRYLLDQPAYYEQYTVYVAEVGAGVLDADTVAAKLSAWETMLAPYVPDSEIFAMQIDTITSFVKERNGAVEVFLSE